METAERFLHPASPSEGSIGVADRSGEAVAAPPALVPPTPTAARAATRAGGTRAGGTRRRAIRAADPADPADPADQQPVPAEPADQQAEPADVVQPADAAAPGTKAEPADASERKPTDKPARKINGKARSNGDGTDGANQGTDSETPPPPVWEGPPVAVLVVDGDTESRNRLSAIINRGEHVVLTGSVGTLADAVEAARLTKPEVVLSELFLPDGDPAALRTRFAPLGPRPQLVVITRFSVRGARVASTVAGARTCLASSAQPDSVLAAVLAAAKGESWDGAGAVGSRLDRVSPLEAKVLAGVASGATNDEIARALGYSVHYVKDLLEAVRHRLGAKDRAHAASLAVSLRLIRPARDGRFISAVPN